MSDDFSSPLLEPSDVSRVRTVAVAIVASIVIITVVLGTMVYVMEPDWGVAGAYGTGFFVGFWISPLAGGVAGNGIHEHRLEQLEKANEDETVPEKEGHPLHAAA